MDVLFYLHVRQVLNFGKSDFLSLLGLRSFVLLERHLGQRFLINSFSNGDFKKEE